MSQAPEKKLKLRQVVFVYFPQEQRIVPLIVVKATTEQTLSGEHTAYDLSYGIGSGAESVITLEQLKAREVIIFEVLAQAKQYLVETATRAIDDMITVAGNNAREMYKFEPVMPPSLEQARSAPVVAAIPAEVSPSEDGLMQMPDGKWVKPKLTFHATN